MHIHLSPTSQFFVFTFIAIIIYIVCQNLASQKTIKDTNGKVLAIIKKDKIYSPDHRLICRKTDNRFFDSQNNIIYQKRGILIESQYDTYSIKNNFVSSSNQQIIFSISQSHIKDSNRSIIGYFSNEIPEILVIIFYLSIYERRT